MAGGNNSQVAVVMVPFPAQGHLNQLLHLSHLVISYGIPVHYAGSATHNDQVKVRVQGWDSESLNNIHFHDFQLPLYNCLPPKPDISVPFPAHLQPLFDISSHLRKPVSELLDQLAAKCRRIIVVHDYLMASVVQDVNFIPNAESFHFVPISAFTRFLNYWEEIPESDKPVYQSDIIPRCIPSREGTTTPEFSSFMVDQKKYWGFESGRIYNTSRAIEGRYVELLEKLSGNNHTDTTHFVLGPFHPVEITANQERRHRCLEWLDEHEKGSVIYVTFGSITSLTVELIRELATGLETSGQKFLWVLRNADKGAAVYSTTDGNPELPQGFEERVKDRGMVIREWAPQLDILAHRSVGGFMSHCGWNSCIESISMGVPIAAWPMHSDQPRNAVLITQVLKIGVTLKAWEDRGKLVSSDTIERAVKTLMTTKEGAEIRKRASELGDSVRKSVSKGGASSLEMDTFIAHITR